MLMTIHSFLPNWPIVSATVPKKDTFLGCNDLEDLANFLISNNHNVDQLLRCKKEIKEFLADHKDDLEKVDQFLQTLTQWGIEQNPQKMMAFLIDIISFELLDDTVKFREKHSAVPYDNVFDWAAEHAPFCPEPEDHSLKTRVYSEWKKCRPIVLYAIPNLINIFLGAFNFLDAHKKFTTLWEKHLLLEIIYKFFVIPYCLIQILQPVFVVTAKVYLVSAVIIVATGVLISSYQRWFRPIPDEVVDCVNLDKQVEMGLIDPKVGQARELERLIAALEVESNVLLIGHSGDGKTALMHHFIQKKHQGELPDKLKQLTVFEVDCGLIVSSYSYGHSEVINQIKEQTEGYDGNVLFFFDEFFPIATSSAAFQAFKKRFLEDKPHAKFVAAITFKQFEEIKKLDTDGSFRRRIVPIMIDSSTDEQSRLIIRELIYRVAKDVPVTDEAVEAILDISNQEDYLVGIGRPAKAIKILMDAIAFCRTAYNPHYVPIELSDARQEYQGLRLQAMQNVKAKTEILQKSRKLQKKISLLEKTLDRHKGQVAKIKKLIAEQRKLTNDYYRLTRFLARAADGSESPKPKDLDLDIEEVLEIEESEEDVEKVVIKDKLKPSISQKSISQDAKVMYLWYHFYAIDAMKTILQSEIDKIRNEMPVQVDEDLINQIYLQSKDVAKAVEDDLYEELKNEKKTEIENDEESEISENPEDDLIKQQDLSPLLDGNEEKDSKEKKELATKKQVDKIEKTTDKKKSALKEPMKRNKPSDRWRKK